MTVEAHDLLVKALGLDAVQRAEMIEALFRSFDTSGDRRVDALWAAEAERRIDAYDSGKLRADSVDAVLDRVTRP